MLNFLDGLYKYPKPGFNQLEREWYWEHVISNEGLLAAYQGLAEKISKEQDIPTSELLEVFMNAAKDPAMALEKLGGHLIDLQQLELRQQSKSRNADGLLVEMFLRSRLTPQWLVANSAAIEQEYGVKVDADYHKGLRRSEWLSDPERKVLVKEFCGLMPAYQIREIAKVATLEMNEGKEVKIPALSSQEQLGKPDSDSQMPDEPPNKNDKTLKMPTSESQNTA